MGEGRVCKAGCGRRVSEADTEGVCLACRYPPLTRQRPPGQRVGPVWRADGTLYAPRRASSGMTGQHHTPESKAKMREVALNHWKDPAWAARMVAGIRVRAARARRGVRDADEDDEDG